MTVPDLITRPRGSAVATAIAELLDPSLVQYERVIEAKLRRTLFLGLGGRGTSLVRSTRAAWTSLFRTDYIPGIEFAGIDLDAMGADDPGASTSVRLPSGRFLQIPSYSPREVGERMKTNDPRYRPLVTAGVLADQLIAAGSESTDEGARQRPAVSFVAAWLAYAKIVEFLDGLLRTINNAGRWEACGRGQFASGFQVIVAASPCGGVGRGLMSALLPYLLRDLTRTMEGAHVRCVPLLVDEYEGDVPNPVKARAETYSLLLELRHYGRPETTYTITRGPGGPVLRDTNPPYDLILPLDCSGGFLNEQEALRWGGEVLVGLSTADLSVVTGRMVNLEEEWK